MQEYLDRITKILRQPVYLYRECADGKLKLITSDPRDFGYLKPSQGFGAKLEYYLIKKEDVTVTRFGLYEFPSCCAFCVSTQVSVTLSYRNRGINKIGNELRQWIARECGYAALFCTDVDTNIPERKTLIANGWKDIFQAKNHRTGNIVNISVKML
jgi:hypothetical protein